MSKEHAYAYEAGYRDGSINYELEHCPACKNIADLQEALADNDRLREQVHWLKKGDILHVLTDQEYIDQCERERLMQVSIDALDKENKELRELCADMEKMLVLACWTSVESDEEASQCIYRARELGIEVDG